MQSSFKPYNLNEHFSLLVLTLLLSTFLPVISVHAGDGDFTWAKSMGGISSDSGRDIFVDSSGNIYVTGSFNSTADFDPGPGTFNLTSAGNGDIFVCKLDSSGNFVWARSMGGTSSEVGYSVSVDADGDVYTTGFFAGTADFDPGPGTFNLTSAGAGSLDIFISKLDSSGSFIWAKSMGGNLGDDGYALSLDSSGNVYTTGVFNGTVDFDPGPGTFNLTSASSDIFISKLDGNGNFAWAKAMGGVGNDIGWGITVDTSGNVYTTGDFLGTADFDPGPGTFNLTSVGNDDIFISKLDSSGNFVWAKAIGGTLEDYGYNITTDSIGNVYTTGNFWLTADFDPGPGVFNLTSAGFQDTFVIKLDSSGNFVWAIAMGGALTEYGYDISVDTFHNVYTTGVFRGTADFDPGTGVFNLNSVGGEDIFISKLDSNGTFVWAQAMGGTSSDQGYGVFTDLSGNVYTTGIFQDSVDFDPGAGIFNLTSAGNWDVFINKLARSKTYPWFLFLPAVINKTQP